MKGFAKALGKKLAEVADSVASYNVPGGVAISTSQPSGTGGPRTSGPGAGLDATSDPVLEFLLRNVRSKHVRTLFHEKVKLQDITEQKGVRVLAASYNVNNKPPTGQDLKEWLGLWEGSWPEGSQGDKQKPDIVCVGLQEVVALNAGNVIIGSSTGNLDAWDRGIGSYLNGEEWAAKQYGPEATGGSGGGSGGGAALASTAGAVLGAMDRAWSSGVESALAASVAAAAGSAGAADVVAAGADGGAFVQIAAKQMVGLYLTVWARRSLLPHIKGIQVTHVATGLGGWTGNKGGVLVRMQVYDSPLVIVNSHLAAGDQEGDEAKRNSDVAEILRRADFSLNGDSPGAMSAPGAALISTALSSGHYGGSKGVTDHGNAIWIGDLNYRLVPSVLPDEEARKHLRAGALQPLLEADQLGREMAGGRVFMDGWREGPITFPPTFKFRVGTHVYLGEPLPSTASVKSLAAADAGDDEDAEAAGGPQAGQVQKKRTPAWCDRVLWHTPRKELHQLAYARGELTASDHKPVAAAFLLQARHYLRPRVEAVLEEARRAADMQRAMLRPKCSLEPIVVMVDEAPAAASASAEAAAVAAGPLRYAEARTYRVALSNAGTVEGVWHWVPPPSRLGLDDEGPALPRWLVAQPAEGVVGPGQTCDITLTVCVEGGPEGAAAELAGKQAGVIPAEPQPLDVIAILRVEDEGDKFLTVTGSFRSCFLGLPLQHLPAQPPAALASPELASLMQAAEGLASSGPLHAALKAKAGAGPAHAAAPWQVQALAGFLAQGRGMFDTPGLFVRSAQQVLQQAGSLGSLPALGQGAEASAGAAAGERPEQAGDKALWRSRPHLRALLQALAGHVDALSGTPGAASVHQLLSSGAGAHAAAALLLAAFGEQPSHVVPLPLSEMCNVQVPRPEAVTSLLSASLPTPDLAALNLLLAACKRLPCMRAAASSLQAPPEAAALAGVLTSVLLARLPPAAPPEASSNRRAMLLALLLA